MFIMTEYFIAWWNVENLFDVENSTTRPEYPLICHLLMMLLRCEIGQIL